MDRAYDSQSKKFLVRETIPKTDKKLSQFTKIRIPNSDSKSDRSNNSSSNHKTFSIDPLDEAMQELLDIYQDYNEKLVNKRQQNQEANSESHGDKNKIETIQTKAQLVPEPLGQENSKAICDNWKYDDKIKQEPTAPDIKNSSQYAQDNFLHQSRPPAVSPESIEMLQEKQAQLQQQLDEVLIIAKKLASKQKRNLTDILEDQEDLEVQSVVKKDQIKEGFKTADDGQEEDDDELIEFQQIENELKISDLKRQLDNIQEELRIKLFKRLLSNTGAKQQIKNLPNAHSIETKSPPSSSRSGTDTDMRPNTLSNSIPEKTDAKKNIDIIDCSLVGRESMLLTQDKDIHGTSVANNEFHSTAYQRPHNTTNSTPTKIHNEGNCSDHDSAVDYTEALSSTTSRESVMSKKNQTAEIVYPHGQVKDNVSPYQAMSPYGHATSPVHSNNYRNNSANSDLERIEEDEDEQDYHRSSDKFRTIYEEKLSPRVLGHLTGDDAINSHQSEKSRLYSNDAYEPKSYQAQPKSTDDVTEVISNQQTSHSCPRPSLNQHNKPNQSRSRRHPAAEITTRPLTLYLPKPDEDIDLIEHVQALGHDIDIISDDIKLSPISAEGYLWKCCAKNANKWLKRYFYYDRKSKVVAYFRSESQLAKKHPSPRDTIPFEEISDVYVDHRRSSLVNNHSPRGRNFVFVLATIGRKYLLAASKAETMRTWIDILFTAAEANDYLEHIEYADDDDHDRSEHVDAKYNLKS